MRLKSEDILKPGAVLRTEKIDYNDEEVKKLFEETRKRQLQLEKLKEIDYDQLHQRVTI